jgi:hypothetical protein
MNPVICPHLGAVDPDRERTDAITYPSFENRCWASGNFDALDGDMLMLTDQATYCLGESHHLCPRYLNASVAQAAKASTGGRAPKRGAASPPDRTALDPAWVTADIQDLERELELIDEEDAERRRVWGWLAAAAVFLLVFGGASMLALYAGWSYVRSIQTAGGSVETLAAAQAPQEPVYLVMTATSPPPPTPTPTTDAVLVAPPATAAAVFPPAVTPTPGGAQNDPGVIVVDPNAQIAQPTLPPPATPVFDFSQPVPEAPTRRPTPTFEIPTSTPFVEPSPTTPPYLGPPVVVFKPDNRSLERDQCTTVRWAVQNVREVYYEGIGVNGEGEREECIEDEDEVYTLAVVLSTGQSEIYTTTVRYIAPTPTPTASPSVTPTPYHTPTWTPVGPTATPTPDLIFGVNLGVDGSVVRGCAAGSSCSATVVVTNEGNGNDNLTVVIQAGSQWPAQLCRADGVCSSNTIVVSNVGPGNSAYVEFRVDIPGDAQGQMAEYTLVAGSDATNNAVRSAPVTITVQAQ